MQQFSKNPVLFHYLTQPFTLKNRSALKAFIKDLCKREGSLIAHINYIFCNDEYLLEVNKSYLKHDYYTDIITFQLSPKGEPLLSDIYISIDRVKENAAAHGTSFQNELHRVIFHGALHLCGYKDKTKKDVEVMRKMEDYYLELYFVPRGTKRG